MVKRPILTKPTRWARASVRRRPIMRRRFALTSEMRGFPGNGESETTCDAKIVISAVSFLSDFALSG